MENTKQVTSGLATATVLDELRASSPETRGALDIFYREVKAPIDRACEFLAYQGAARAFDTALGLLQEPNLLALSIRDMLNGMTTECARFYADQGFVDVYARDRHKFAACPAWKALAKTGELEPDDCLAARAAIGVNLGLAWVGQKKMADGHMRRIAASVPGLEADLADLQAVLALPMDERSSAPPWLHQFEKFLHDFRETFDVKPGARPGPKTFEEKAKSEWRARAAFPSHRRRAGVLDKNCLSKRQVALACQAKTKGVFSSPQARRIVIWLTGFSGLFAGTTPSLPVCCSTTDDLKDDWVAKYDVETGLLLRDYAALMPDAANSKGLDAEPASPVFALPAPQAVYDDIKSLMVEVGPCDTFGTLIPELQGLLSHWSIYPSTDGLTPSWAKLSQTVGPLLRQAGMDSYVVAALVGDFGLTAKSKAYYARLSAQEIWQAARRAYSILDLGEPVPMPLHQLAFGAGVVPSTETLRDIDAENVRRVDLARPPRRYAIDRASRKNLLEFHRAYTIALAYRLMVMLALRATASFPLTADIDETYQACVDLIEKSSAKRKGGIATVLPSTARAAIQTYKLHCAMLYKRLCAFHFRGVAMQWLQDVSTSKSVPLLGIIHADGRIQQINTQLVLDTISPDHSIVKDFGRKWLENTLRTASYGDMPSKADSAPIFPAAIRTDDIDRALRHEVLGQETTTSTADASERAWVKRMGQVLDRLTKDIFTNQLQGLRKK